MCDDQKEQNFVSIGFKLENPDSRLLDDSGYRLLVETACSAGKRLIGLWNI